MTFLGCNCYASNKFVDIRVGNRVVAEISLPELGPQFGMLWADDYIGQQSVEWEIYKLSTIPTIFNSFANPILSQTKHPIFLDITIKTSYTMASPVCLEEQA